MIGLLCPGQGSQFVGMGRDLADEFATARATFQEANEALGLELSRLCWEGSEDELRQTVNAQPAILVHTVAAWRVLTEHQPVRVDIAAGHSLGEFSAYVAAGSIAFQDAVRLVRRRGELMQHAGQSRKGSMTALLGIDDTSTERLCRRVADETGAVVVPANYNAPGQIVISGDPDAVQRAAEIARNEEGKRSIPLNVSGAFHSPLMEPAVAGLRASLAGTPIDDPTFPVVSNVTGEPNDRGGEVRALLERQLTGPVRWVQSVRAMIDGGATEFLEVGPGDVLTGLVRRIDRSVPSRPIGTAAQIRAYFGE